MVEFARALADHRALVERLESVSEPVAAGAEQLITAFRSGKLVLLAGNGGSATDAEHLAGELVGRFRFHRAPLPALALGQGLAVTTAIGNDYAFPEILARQTEAYLPAAGALVVISTSGQSANLIEAARRAQAADVPVIALTGEGPNPLADGADVAICVPSRDTPRIQEAHILIGHAWCEHIEARLFGSEPA